MNLPRKDISHKYVGSDDICSFVFGLSFSTVLSRSIRVEACISTQFLLKVKQYSIIYHSSVDWHFRRFYLLLSWIILQWTRTDNYLFESLLPFLEYILRNRIIFRGTVILVPSAAVPFCFPSSNGWEFQILHVLSNTCYFLGFVFCCCFVLFGSVLPCFNDSHHIRCDEVIFCKSEVRNSLPPGVHSCTAPCFVKWVNEWVKINELSLPWICRPVQLSFLSSGEIRNLHKEAHLQERPTEQEITDLGASLPSSLSPCLRMSCVSIRGAAGQHLKSQRTVSCTGLW
jgi:hypothetical protein